jgi:hypothetical protein
MSRIHWQGCPRLAPLPPTLIQWPQHAHSSAPHPHPDPTKDAMGLTGMVDWKGHHPMPPCNRIPQCSPVGHRPPPKHQHPETTHLCTPTTTIHIPRLPFSTMCPMTPLPTTQPPPIRLTMNTQMPNNSTRHFPTLTIHLASPHQPDRRPLGTCYTLLYQQYYHTE